MLKMIIVDDEKIIRETIHSLIDWNSLGIDVAAAVSYTHLIANPACIQNTRAAPIRNQTANN